MATLEDKQILDLTGGLTLDKSDIQLEDNQLKDSLNCDLDETGRLKRRRGIQQYGDTGSGVFDNSFLFWLQAAGAAPTAYHIIATNAATSNIYRMVGTYNEIAVAVGDVVITVDTTGLFAGAPGGTININGDLITYTATTGTTFTGCLGITRAHPAYSFVTQLRDEGAEAINGQCGVYFSVLNNELYIQGRLGGVIFDGVNFTAVADADEAAGLFATNYRERIYCAGSGGAGGSINSTPTRVAFTEPGDATDWGDNTVNFFDVEDDRGESITGLKELNDTLLIFKENSLFTYDEIQLKQRLWDVGAYNHRVVQRLGEIVYTFCPTGVWVTNGFEAQKISGPVDKILQSFQPVFDTTLYRVVTNCFAGTFEGKYYLYLSDLEEPHSRDDIVLVYDTIKGNWTVHNHYKNFRHFASLKAFVQGGPIVGQQKACLFAGDSAGKYFRLFDNRFADRETPRLLRGGDIIPDTFSETQEAVQTTAETKFYLMGDDITQQARVRKIGALVEQGTFQISYRIDRGTHITDWISLGDFKATITESKLKENYNTGYRIAFKITSNDANVIGILNGIILKEREILETTRHGIKNR